MALLRFTQIAFVVSIFATLTYAGPVEKADSGSEESGESKETSSQANKAQGPHVCTHLNQTYSLGEHIQTPDASCLHCTCTRRWSEPSSTNCAIIDCPFVYYKSRPHCKTRYVEGRCCPELDCSPPPPGFETELLSGKKPHTPTDKMVITAAPGKEVTLYCIAQTEGDKPLDLDLIHWVHKLPNGTEVPVQMGKTVIPKFFPPKTWALLLDELQQDSAGEYTCHIKTEPPQSYTTTLHIHIRDSARIDACAGPTSVELAPGAHTCDQLDGKGYYYNGTLLNCMEYEVQPCKKPVNYFSTRSECFAMCGDPCYKEKKEGSCDVRERRYYYDHVNDGCSTFTFRGCKGNRNNFQSQEECENTCADVKFRLKGLEGRIKPEAVEKEEPPPCHNMPCPWHQWLHYMWKGCKAITKPNACCPHRFECPPAQPELPTGQTPARPDVRDLGTYHCAGKFADKFSVSVPNCLNCSCDPATKTFTCEGGNECMDQDVDKKLKENCFPLYLEDTCCPHSYYCPHSFKFPQRGPHEDFPEAPELRCKYAGRTYPREYELIVKDDCVTCTCLTPPDFTCVVQTCPPHPSTVNETVRCEQRSFLGRQCCPEYDCWDINEKPSLIGKPQTPKEKKICDDNPCGNNYQTCLVNYTECYSGSCQRICQPCPVPMCGSGGYLQDIPYDCPGCTGHKTPEEACEAFRGCPDDSECHVDEDMCRNEGSCNTFCRLNDMQQMFVLSRIECPMPRCPPTCGFKNGSDGCRQCDCSIPRGPIKETPCIKECPQDCGQTVRLDGCLECDCSSEPFFNGKTPMPMPPSGEGSNEECLRECPQDCGRTERGNGCFECHCNVGPFFGNHGTPKPPPGVDTNPRVPCASVSCSFPCWPAPAEADGCSKSCLCPKTPEEACTKLECPKESTCTADCEGGRCVPHCLLQQICPTAICDSGCTLEADDKGCKTLCKCP